MKTPRFAPLLASIILTAALASPFSASAHSRPALRMDTRVTVQFRIQVTGASSPHTTFWVAYGPVDGKFGIVQLKRSGHGLYTASRRLAATATVDLAYLTGHGVIHTRFGPAPGNPVVTIRSIPPTQVRRLVPRTVEWQLPTG